MRGKWKGTTYEPNLTYVSGTKYNPMSKNLTFWFALLAELPYDSLDAVFSLTVLSLWTSAEK